MPISTIVFNLHSKLIFDSFTLGAQTLSPLIGVNPEILNKEGETVSKEGCLSVPGYLGEVTRAEKISVSYIDRYGVQKELEVSGLLAICIQHEIDHLNGKLFIDYLSEAKRQKIRKIIQKQRQSSPPSSPVF